jgi:hypothetical protein
MGGISSRHKKNKSGCLPIGFIFLVKVASKFIWNLAGLQQTNFSPHNFQFIFMVTGLIDIEFVEFKVTNAASLSSMSS